MSSNLRDRLRILASLLVLCTVAFTVESGRILPDTKLDMALNPSGFLARALHLWDASASFGQVQNQAYGYFFPMGPFYWFFDLLHVPPWITQRLWLSLVLCVAFLGVIRLARALGIGGPNSRLVAGFAYALAPRAQELLGINSSEFWPTAVLPWILLPLITQKSPRRAAAWSALAVVCCGGINATAVLAVLAVPLIYLLMHRRRVLLWWLPLTAAASFWWLAPTYVMGRYIFPFIAYTETAATTTSVTSLANILRGTSQWNGFLPGFFSPWWPAGLTLSTTPWLVLVTGLVAALGLYGLRRAPAFLTVTLLAGLAIIVTGHAGTLFGDTFRDLLDGPLGPFRNLHKFDALVRLPIVLGLAALRPVRFRRLDLRWLAVGVVALSAYPVLSPGMAAIGAPRGIPQYVRDANGWLDARNDGTVLAVPGQQFGRYVWGNVMDDPLQPLLKGRWASRMITPSGSVGMARLLEAIDARFATGRGSPGLAAVLRRMGVRYLLVRNDIDRGSLDGAWPGRVHEALAAMPGVTRAASFGREVGFPFGDAVGGFDQKYKALEIYRLDALPQATTVVREPLRVSGGPEALIDLADRGLLDGDRPVIFNEGAADVATDTLRRREVSFSDLRGGGSVTMTADQEYTGPSKVKDFTAPGWASHESVAELSGIKDVTASSSEETKHPFAALDGDPKTHWASSGWSGAVGQWLRLGFTAPLDPGTVDVAFERSDLLGPPVTEVAVETAAGRLVQAVGEQPLRVPSGPSDWLRIEVTRTAEGAGNLVAISELTVPGVRPVRSIAVPGNSGTHVFTGLYGYTPACMKGPESWVCSPLTGSLGEEGRTFNRTFTAPSGSVVLTGSAIMTDPDLIGQYTESARASSSSRLVDHPAAFARSAFDADPSTTWTAAPDDKEPSLTRDLGRMLTVSQLRFKFPAERDAMRVMVTGDGETREALVGGSGVAVFEPITARKLTFTFTGKRGIQVRDIEIPGVAPLPSQGQVTFSCGSGPTFSVGGREVRTRLLDTGYGTLLSGREVPFEACSMVPLSAGRQQLSVEPDGFLIGGVALRPKESPVAVLADAAKVGEWTSSSRSVDVPGPSYLVVNENFNKGWTASLDGRRLTPVLLDGWKQAWEVPSGGTVSLRFAPDGLYRGALIAGLGLVILVAVCAFVPSRSVSPVTRPVVPGWIWVMAPVFGLWAGGPLGLVVGAVAGWKAVRNSAPVLVALAAWTVALGGHLFSRGYSGPHELLNEQIPGVLCIAAAALLIGLLPAGEALGGTFDHDIVDGREGRRQDHGHDHDGPEVAAEAVAAGERVPRLDDRRVPEEDAERDQTQA